MRGVRSGGDVSFRKDWLVLRCREGYLREGGVRGIFSLEIERRGFLRVGGVVEKGGGVEGMYFLWMVF